MKKERKFKLMLILIQKYLKISIFSKDKIAYNYIKILILRNDFLPLINHLENTENYQCPF